MTISAHLPSQSTCFFFFGPRVNVCLSAVEKRRGARGTRSGISGQRWGKYNCSLFVHHVFDNCAWRVDWSFICSRDGFMFTRRKCSRVFWSVPLNTFLRDWRMRHASTFNIDFCERRLMFGNSFVLQRSTSSACDCVVYCYWWVIFLFELFNFEVVNLWASFTGHGEIKMYCSNKIHALCSR